MAAKDDILLKLAENRETALSGQAMADELHISRNAVWKAIERLKSEGYRIESGNGGYRLSGNCDRLIARRLDKILDNPHADAEGESFSPDVNVYVFHELDSTNNECKRRLPDELQSFAVLAEKQTAGRGRDGNTFFSPEEKGLYLSIVLKRQISLHSASALMQYTAQCVIEEIRRQTGLSCFLKGTNEIFYLDKKVCGILIEGVCDLAADFFSDVIIGIGIHLHPASLPDELQNIAGALDCGPVKNELAAALIRRVSNFAVSEP